MRLLVICLCLLYIIPTSTFAQKKQENPYIFDGSKYHWKRKPEKFGDRFFFSWGFTSFTEGFLTPVHIYLDPVNPNISYLQGTVNIGIVSGTSEFRYNIFETGPEMAYSIHVPLNMALSFSTTINGDPPDSMGIGFGHLNLPIVFGANWGLGSTYFAEEPWGATLGVGAQAIVTPLYKTSHEPVRLKVNKVYYQPLIATSFRYWRKNAKMREFSIHFWPGKRTDRTRRIDNLFGEYRSFYVKFNLMMYLYY